MKKEKINKILSIIAVVAVILFFIIGSIITKQYRALIATLIMVAILGLLFLILYMIIWRLDSFEKKYNKFIKKIESKENKSVFDNLLLESHKSKLDDLIRNNLKEKNINGVNSLEAYANYKNRILIYYKYIGFNVGFSFEEDTYKYRIDSRIINLVIINNQINYYSFLTI